MKDQNFGRFCSNVVSIEKIKKEELTEILKSHSDIERSVKEKEME